MTDVQDMLFHCVKALVSKNIKFTIIYKKEK